MSADTKGVSVKILDKEYLVACPESERDKLFASVEYLNRKMQELRETGKVIGSERIAVMTALNIAHEFLEYKSRKEDYTLKVDAGIERLQAKIAGALSKGKQLEF